MGSSCCKLDNHSNPDRKNEYTCPPNPDGENLQKVRSNLRSGPPSIADTAPYQEGIASLEASFEIMEERFPTLDSANLAKLPMEGQLAAEEAHCGIAGLPSVPEMEPKGLPATNYVTVLGAKPLPQIFSCDAEEQMDNSIIQSKYGSHNSSIVQSKYESHNNSKNSKNAPMNAPMKAV